MSGFFWVNYEPATCHGCHRETRGGWCPDVTTAACVVPDAEAPTGTRGDETLCGATGLRKHDGSEDQDMRYAGSAHKRAAPAGNRGLTSKTAKES